MHAPGPTIRLAILAAAFAALTVAGCGSNGDGDGGTSTASGGARSGLPQGSEPFKLDPARFTTKIDNPYFPVAPGARWVYRSAEGGKQERIVVTVSNDTKKIQGITSRVVRDLVTSRGRLVEDTFDWYAQDSDGNVWYMGEDTKEYKNGKVSSTAGSWEAGVDGAEAGVIMPGNPRPGVAYRQEYYKGKAEDRGKILSTQAKANVPFKRFAGSVETADTTPLEPKTLEHKYYAKGVGLVLTIGVGTGSREGLVSFRRPR
jgi:hypothetical protein